ncbi:efflux transporter outer membrane subunit [Undibacterium sp.]|jgi:NodT family efflux transporter outer membrane factor (OMF) lipoprotein|uniref:efflux transporter outer membrane subunit n=1 Tax=Undibacterium sp. TaxID=1914977 RepID=UPI002BA9247D|nr:efflux transporter outer membrane subunit [Undibacterium sp.]HTD04797.1 efflux transporter outer membrane subunit [Undibacterium sp.]
MQRLYPLAFTLLIASCAITRVEPPAVPAPEPFKETALWQHAAGVDAATVPDDWWALFKDPVLDDLAQRLTIGNENLKISLAQVASARAVMVASRSALFPTLSVGLAATRSATPTSSNQPSTTSAVQNPANSVSLQADASWEVDLWRRLSQASAGAQASYQASADDLAAAGLSAHATLVQTYFSMRTAEAQHSLLERSVQAYQRSLDLTRARYEGGVAALSDVLQAQTQLKTAQAQLLETAIQRAQFEHAIAVLLGMPPSALTLERSTALPVPPAVPELLSSTLLERRPDIAAAQRRVAAAYLQIGVADAAFFPALTLSANVGYRQSSFGNLLSAPNLFWSLGSSLAQAIFDGGQRKLASDQARASADQATATYRQTVLTAFQEVEDNLVLADHLQKEAAVQQEALQAAQRNVEITLDQYKAGTVSYLNVVTAQTAALTSESTLLSVQNRQLAAVSLLLKNIAGRWEKV